MFALKVLLLSQVWLLDEQLARAQAVLFGHDLVPCLDLFYLSLCMSDVLSNLPGQGRLPDMHVLLLLRASRGASRIGPLRPRECSDESSIVRLSVLRIIVPSFRVDIVAQQVSSVNSSSGCWVDIAVPVSAEGRPAEVSRERRVWEPSCRLLELVDSLLDVFPLLFGSFKGLRPSFSLSLLSCSSFLFLFEHLLDLYFLLRSVE